MANILQQQYSSVYSCPDVNFMFEDAKDFFSDTIDDNPLTDIHVTTEDVTIAIRELKPSFGAGPDHLPAILLKFCSTSLSTPLAQVFNNSIQTGTLPNLLKLARVILIHKGGSTGQSR